MTKSHLERRLAKIEEMQRLDRDRFKQNPSGPGYLTRNERYNELRWELQSKIEAH